MSSPWSLQMALTNNTIVKSGDTIFLRGGTYFPTTTWPSLGVNILGWEPTIKGTNGSVVTIESYTNEWAAIDREWDLKNEGAAYLRFYNLEFYDSLKGHNLTNNEFPTGPWVHFSTGIGNGFQWVNCVIHDVDNAIGGGPNVDSVRGCVIWNVGVSGLEHVCYPAPTNFSGNVVGWTVNDVIEHQSADMLMQSNIIFGSGQTSTNTQGIDTKNDSYSVTLRNNYTYNQFPAGTPVPILAQGVTFNGIGFAAVSNNVFVAPQPVFFTLGTGYTNIIFKGNQSFMSEVVTSGVEAVYQNISSPMTNSSQVFNSNSYFINSPFIDFTFAQATNATFNYLSWLRWTNSGLGFDLGSTTNYGTPANQIYVIANQDQAKRCNIAAYNFTTNSTVSVNLSSVLNAGDTYQLYNAQDYGRGVIQSGTYNGINLTVPMTNLTTAPILYGTNWGLFQAPPMSPTFGAFVVIGAAPVATYFGNVTATRLIMQ